jgi:hypothetical protein
MGGRNRMATFSCTEAVAVGKRPLNKIHTRRLMCCFILASLLVLVSTALPGSCSAGTNTEPVESIGGKDEGLQMRKAFDTGRMNTELQESEDSWPMFRHDLNHMGYSTSQVPDGPSIDWAFQAVNGFESSPVIEYGMVFIGSDDHNVYALKEDTGELVWNYTTGHYVRPTPAVAEGKVFVGSSDGRAYLFLGGASMSSPISASNADVTFSAHNNDEKFGFSVAGAGRQSNDNDDDLLIASPLFDDGQDVDKGRVYLYLGEDQDLDTADATFTGETANDNFGYSVSSAGDMDNDGYDEVLAGAPKYGNGDKGRAYVFLGVASPSGDTGASGADVKVTGQSDGDELGYSVSSAGNINNDDYDDIIIGAPKNDGGDTDRGRVYIFYGSSTPNNWDEVFVTGVYENGAGEKKGWSVSCAGDVNNDGYDDIVIGAPYREDIVSMQPVPEGRMEVWGDPS